MKKFRLLAILLTMLLSSCGFFQKDYTIKATYLKKGDSTEYEIGETIKYGESFNFDKFLLYKVQDGKSTLLNESTYTVSFSGNEGLSEDLFKSSLPEVGEYTFAFDYKALGGKSKYTGMSFKVISTNNFPSNVSLSIEDWDYFGTPTLPTINNYVSSGTPHIEYYLFNIDTDQNFGKIVIDDDHRVLNMPGRYRITAIVDDHHYTNASVSCEFNINKVDFPSETLEVYKTYYSFTFNIDHKTIEGYDIGDARIRYIETREEFPVDRESASLRWKEPDKEISTSERTKHIIVLSSSYFNDYEYEVDVVVAKREVDEPGGIYIDEFDSFKGDSIKYDGEEHTAHVLDLAFFGQYRVNEELSTLKATEKGTYTVVVELVDKDNLLWKKTHNNVDLSYTWTIY